MSKERLEIFCNKAEIASPDSAAVQRSGSIVLINEDPSALLIVFGSETGNAQSLATRLSDEAKKRNVRSHVLAMDDVDTTWLHNTRRTVVFVISTCGQGLAPKNAQGLMKYLNSPERTPGCFSTLQFAIFGLGDSAYVHFCKTAGSSFLFSSFFLFLTLSTFTVTVDLEARLLALGARARLPRGIGNDQSPNKFEDGWEDWEPRFWATLNVPVPPLPHSPPPPILRVEAIGSLRAFSDVSSISPAGTSPLRLITNQRVTPPDYDRDIRLLEFDIDGSVSTLSESLSVSFFVPFLFVYFSFSRDFHTPPEIVLECTLRIILTLSLNSLPCSALLPPLSFSSLLSIPRLLFHLVCLPSALLNSFSLGSSTFAAALLGVSSGPSLSMLLIHWNSRPCFVCARIPLSSDNRLLMRHFLISTFSRSFGPFVLLFLISFLLFHSSSLAITPSQAHKYVTSHPFNLQCFVSIIFRVFSVLLELVFNCVWF